MYHRKSDEPRENLLPEALVSCAVTAVYYMNPVLPNVYQSAFSSGYAGETTSISSTIKTEGGTWKTENSECLSVITTVERPTARVSQIVVTQKKDSELRVCIDPTEINQALKREHFIVNILEKSIRELGKSGIL